MCSNKVSIYVDDVRVDKGQIVLADSAVNIKERMGENKYLKKIVIKKLI
jgi:hypothetical protein